MKKIIQNIFKKIFNKNNLIMVLAATVIYAAPKAITFSNGDVLTAEKLQTSFEIAAPQGAIMAFYLDSCPDGWAAADGGVYSGVQTPNLQGRFVRGAIDNAGDVTNENRTTEVAAFSTGSKNIGGYQADAFAEHNHKVVSGGTLENSDYGYNDYDSSQNRKYLATRGMMGTNDPDYFYSLGFNTVAPTRGESSSEGASETRVKNVALLYCMRVNQN